MTIEANDMYYKNYPNIDDPLDNEIRKLEDEVERQKKRRRIEELKQELKRFEQ